MPQSDLAKIIQNTDGKVALGTTIDYSGVFEVLGTGLERRVNFIGEGQGSSKSVSLESLSENELTNITFALDGIWLKDNNLKMVALGLVLYGNSPYKRDSDIIIALDPNKNNNDLTAQGMVGNTASFPRKLDDDTIQAIENRVQNKDVRAGLCVSRELFNEYYTRFFPNDNFSSSKDTDFDNLVSQGLLWAEVLWKTSESGGSVYKFPVFSQYVLPSSSRAMLKFPACLSAIPEYQNAGIKLFVDGTQIYNGNGTEPIKQLNYDWRTGRTGVTLDELKQLDAEIDAKEYTQLSNQTVFVRFFSADETKAQSALGHNLHKDFFKTNGQNAAYQVKRVAAWEGTGTSGMGMEAIWFGIQAIVAGEGGWTQCDNPGDTAGTTIGAFSYTTRHQAKEIAKMFDLYGLPEIARKIRPLQGSSKRDLVLEREIKNSGCLTDPRFHKIQIDVALPQYILSSIVYCKKHNFTSRLGIGFLIRASLQTGGYTGDINNVASFNGSIVNSNYLGNVNGTVGSIMTDQAMEERWLTAAWNGMRGGPYAGWRNEAKAWESMKNNGGGLNPDYFLDTSAKGGANHLDGFGKPGYKWGTVPATFVKYQDYIEEKVKSLNIL